MTDVKKMQKSLGMIILKKNHTDDVPDVSKPWGRTPERGNARPGVGWGVGKRKGRRWQREVTQVAMGMAQVATEMA